MFCGFTTKASVGAGNDDSLAGEGVRGCGKFYKKLTVKKGKACGGHHKGSEFLCRANSV